MSLADLLNGICRTGDGLTADIAASWMQGRTAYGGASTALALAAVRQEAKELPPLQSAQVAFIAPLAGRITLKPQLLRSGSNSAFAAVDLFGESGLGLRATFLFSRERPSSIDYAEPLPADIELTPEMTEPPARPARGNFFADHFDYRPSRRSGNAASPCISRWVRVRCHEEVSPELEFVALADALPPAATKLMGKSKIASSINWTINLLSPAPVTRDGWWLLRSDTITARHGLSSQIMTIWNRDSTMVAVGMQSVALYT